MSTCLSNAQRDIEDCIERGEYEKAKKEIQNAERCQGLEENDVYQIAILKCTLYNSLGEFNKTIELLL